MCIRDRYPPSWSIRLPMLSLPLRMPMKLGRYFVLHRKLHRSLLTACLLYTSMAHAAKQLIGVEIVPEAIENAKENAKRNGISNSEFLCGDAAKAAVTLQKQMCIRDSYLVYQKKGDLKNTLSHRISIVSIYGSVLFQCLNVITSIATE